MPPSARVVVSNGFVPVLGRRVSSILGVGLPEATQKDPVCRHMEVLKRWECFVDAVR